MDVQPVQNHHCVHVACKCNIDGNQSYCSPFCKDVETSEDDNRCGCGHTDCDTTPELGNVATFEATGSWLNGKRGCPFSPDIAGDSLPLGRILLKARSE